MNTMKDIVLRELMNISEYRKAEMFNAHHASNPKELDLHLVDVNDKGEINHKAIENKCAKIVACIVNGKMKCIDFQPNHDASLEEQMDDTIDALKEGIALAMGEVTLNKGINFSSNEMDIFVFNKHPDSEEARYHLKAQVYHEMVESLIPNDVYLLKKLCDRVFHKYEFQDLSQEEKRAITRGVEATNELQVTLIGESFKKTRGEELNTRNLEESLMLYKEMFEVFKRNCKSSSWYRIKAHLFGKTGAFKRVLKYFRKTIIEKGLEPEYLKIALEEENGITRVVAEAKANDLKTYEQVLEEKAEKARIAKEKAELKADEEKRRLQVIEDRRKRIELQIELRKKQIEELRVILREYYKDVSDEEYEKIIQPLERRKDFFVVLKKFDEEKELEVRDRMFNEEREISNMQFDHKED